MPNFYKWKCFIQIHGVCKTVTVTKLQTPNSNNHIYICQWLFHSENLMIVTKLQTNNPPWTECNISITSKLWSTYILEVTWSSQQMLEILFSIANSFCFRFSSIIRKIGCLETSIKILVWIIIFNHSDFSGELDILQCFCHQNEMGIVELTFYSGCILKYPCIYKISSS